MKETNNPIARFFIPRYNELALFLMSISFVLLFFTQSVLRNETHLLVFHSINPKTYAALALFVIGILYSIYHVFTDRKKTEWEKVAMLFFAVTINGVSGVAAGIHMLKDSHGILLLFPIWNIINGILLMLLFWPLMRDKSDFTDENATLSQMLVGSIVIVATLVVCNSFFQLYWAVTFSLCVIYATNLNSIFENTLSSPQSKFKKIETESIPRATVINQHNNIALQTCTECKKSVPEDQGKIRTFVYHKNWIENTDYSAEKKFICKKCFNSRFTKIIILLIISLLFVVFLMYLAFYY